MESFTKGVVSAILVFGILAGIVRAEDAINLALDCKVTGSSVRTGSEVSRAADGIASDASRWLSEKEGQSWIVLELSGRFRLGGLHIYSGYGESAAVEDFTVQYRQEDRWLDVPSARIIGNRQTALRIAFDDSVDVTTSALRVFVTRTHQQITRIKEITVWPYSSRGIPQLGAGVKGWKKRVRDEEIPLIYLNQSGFNLNESKRFTAPTLPDGTEFRIRAQDSDVALYRGVIRDHIGDFTPFNPESTQDYFVEADTLTSVPFRIGPWWLERVTYQAAVDFMIDSRHYHGTYTWPCAKSFGWRDDCHFAFELNTLVAQYLSNPLAYERMPRQVRYKPPSDPKLWGRLEPYPNHAPDIIKMIHWGADVIVSQRLRHEMLKEQLAYFLYAWPWLKPWLSEQNYQIVYDYAFAHWGDADVSITYPHDTTPEHDLFRVKTALGTTKGEMPPGHSVQPNLLMYEVAQRAGRPDAERYFQAAYAQTQWMIQNLDWEDPQTTKGQRMSEHVTMTGLAHFLAHHPSRAPTGLREKIHDWAQVVVRRADNMWDFRRLTDRGDWTPSGPQATMWNEPGNVVGFPACVLAALQVIEDSELRDRLQQLVYSHFDNAFGRNPTGRHFSYDAPRELEGVEAGWYSYYKGGIGQLEQARFVLDGAPKREHYPYHPEVGNISWTEGWVNFNTAFNASLACKALHDTQVTLSEQAGTLVVDLHAPLNFDYEKDEPVTLMVTSRSGDREQISLTEATPLATHFVGAIPLSHATVAVGDGVLQAERGHEVECGYGYGYMRAVGKRVLTTHASCSERSELLVLTSSEYSLEINTANLGISFSDNKGNRWVPCDPVSSLFINGSPVVSANISSDSDLGAVLRVETEKSEEAIVTVNFEHGVARIEVNPRGGGKNKVSLRFGGMPVAHGLGDAGGWNKTFDLAGAEEKIFDIVNDGGGKRWLSTFAIFPRNNFAGVFFDRGVKSVVLSERTYQLNTEIEGTSTFYLFVGEPRDIYANYKRVRNENGYEDIIPKSRLFELGWESWDALGWNVRQQTVKDTLSSYLANGYPIRWAVTGSGFWRTGETTTSFGKWGKTFPNPVEFKDWMHTKDIFWMIGLRTNFIPSGGPHVPRTKKGDRNLKVVPLNGNSISDEALERNFFLTGAKGVAKRFVSRWFPLVPCYVLDGDRPGAATWYQKQYRKWGVDGIKEDTMLNVGSETSIFNKPIAEIAAEGGLVMARCGEFSSPGTLQRINDTGVREMQGRIPINYMQYAACGVPNVYSDVAGIHNMHNVKAIDANVRHAWLLSLTAGMAVGAFPSKWTAEEQAVFKKAVDFHHALVPYLYSAGMSTFETGYPFTLTPMSIAFPHDANAVSFEHFQWMIGESVLAAPLLRNYRDGKKDVYLPDGTWFDWETGRRFLGPVTLEAYDVPLHKVPCFVGGKGVVLLRNGNSEDLIARVYGVGKQAVSDFYTLEEGKKYTIETETTDLGRDTVLNLSTREEVPFSERTGFIEFPVAEGCDYLVRKSP